MSYVVLIRNATQLALSKPKGMRIEFNNDITLQMETDYGRIRIQIDIGDNIETRYRICLICNYHNLEKGGIKVHLARKHNELLLKHYDVRRPFCPETYRDLGSISRHLYKKTQCDFVRNIKLFIDRGEVWNDICLNNTRMRKN